MGKWKKAVLGALAALTMGAVAPAAVAAPSIPSPVEAPRPSPVEKTDGRRERGYHVPRQHGKKWRGSQPTSRLMKSVRTELRPLNRWWRRSLTKAAMAGRGLAPEAPRGEGHRTYYTKVMTPDGKVVGRPTTRRTAEKLARMRAFREMMRAKALAARVIAAAEVES